MCQDYQPDVNAPDLPDEQLLVLTVLHAWQYQGRVRVDPHGDRMETLKHVPDYYLEAELHRTGIDVQSMLQLLAEKELVRMGSDRLDVEGDWRLPGGRTFTVKTEMHQGPNGELLCKTEVSEGGRLRSARGRIGPTGEGIQLTRAGIDIVERANAPSPPLTAGEQRDPVSQRLDDQDPCEWQLPAGYIRTNDIVHGARYTKDGKNPTSNSINCRWREQSERAGKPVEVVRANSFEQRQTEVKTSGESTVLLIRDPKTDEICHPIWWVNDRWSKWNPRK